MCGATAVAVMTIASTAMAVKQQMDQADYQSDMADYQAGMADYNARLAENQAQDIINKGHEEENAHRRKVAQMMSSQRAQMGAAGVDLSSGSALAIQEDTEYLGEVDALRIRDNYSRQAEATLQGATIDRANADAYRAQGDFAQVAGNNNAMGSILSGGVGVMNTGVADKWFTPDSAGISSVQASRM